jgi:hypothetical protein
MNSTVKAGDILAYTYQADYHCVDCTRKRFFYLYVEPNRSIVTTNFETDDNGILYTQLDSEGNFVHPVFYSDQWIEYDESYMAENPTQYMLCGDCHIIIDQYSI